MPVTCQAFCGGLETHCLYHARKVRPRVVGALDEGGLGLEESADLPKATWLNRAPAPRAMTAGSCLPSLSPLIDVASTILA